MDSAETCRGNSVFGRRTPDLLRPIAGLYWGSDARVGMFQLMDSLFKMLERGEQSQAARLRRANRDNLIAEPSALRAGEAPRAGAERGGHLRQLVDRAPLKNGRSSIAKKPTPAKVPARINKTRFELCMDSSSRARSETIICSMACNRPARASELCVAVSRASLRFCSTASWVTWSCSWSCR